MRDEDWRPSVFCVSTQRSIRMRLGGRMDTGLTGKTALITGAASGIGYTTALAFAREGVHLALIDRDEGEARRAGR